MSKLQYTDAHCNKVISTFVTSAQAAHDEFKNGRCHKCPLYSACSQCDAFIDDSEVR